MTPPLVRALFRSVRIGDLSAPNDTAQLKIYYPARRAENDGERNTGDLPVVSQGGPFPIVILLPGMNVGPEGLGWLAQLLCARGLVVVSYSLIALTFGGQVGLTPGIDIAALAPQIVGTVPSAIAIAPILADLAACNQVGILAGRLDLSKVVLGGHSAGGTVALLNANPYWFDGVCGAFAYGAHTGASTMLGYQKGAMNMIPASIPVLIMGGEQDGVIAQSAPRYGDAIGDATGRVLATFDQGVTRTCGDSVVAILKGANHFSIIAPQDTSTGRGFLDWPDTSVDAHSLIEALVWAFLATAMGMTGANQAWADVEARRPEFLVLKRK
jgi:hypothetical protein